MLQFVLLQRMKSFTKSVGNPHDNLQAQAKHFCSVCRLRAFIILFTIKDNGSGIKLKCFRNFQMCCVSLKANVSLMECNTCYCAQAI